MNEVQAIRTQKDSLMMRAGLIPTSEFEQEWCSLEAKEAAAIKEYRASRTWNDTYQEVAHSVKQAAGQALVTGLVGGLAGAVTDVAICQVARSLPIQLAKTDIPPGVPVENIGKVGGRHGGYGGSKPSCPNNGSGPTARREVLENATLGAFAATGTAIGAVVGQALIPVPGAGAAAGGLVGSVVGSGLGALWNHATR